MKKLLLTTAIAALTATAALADHMFIMPSTSNLNGSQSIVQIDAAGADNIFQFDHRPMPLDSIKVYRPDGSENPKSEGLQSRFRSTFDLKLDAPGTWKIAATNLMVSGTAMIDGVERRVASMRMASPPTAPGRIWPKKLPIENSSAARRKPRCAPIARSTACQRTAQIATCTTCSPMASRKNHGEMLRPASQAAPRSTLCSR